MNLTQYRPIGIIHRPYKTPEGTPIKPPASKGVKDDVEVFEKYAAGLAELEGFSQTSLNIVSAISINALVTAEPL